jgi:hypothetical protein
MPNGSKRWRAAVTDSQIRGWRRAGYTLEHISRVTGMTTCQISQRIQQVFSVPRAEDPDEQTIAARCDEIQRGWSDDERAKRWVGRGGRWSATGVHGSVVRSILRSQSGCDELPASTLICAQS